MPFMATEGTSKTSPGQEMSKNSDMLDLFECCDASQTPCQSFFDHVTLFVVPEILNRSLCCKNVVHDKTV